VRISLFGFLYALTLTTGLYSLLDSSVMDFQNCFLLIFIFVFLSKLSHY
jgi:hypothetical protein